MTEGRHTRHDMLCRCDACERTQINAKSDHKFAAGHIAATMDDCSEFYVRTDPQIIERLERIEAKLDKLTKRIEIGGTE